MTAPVGGYGFKSLFCAERGIMQLNVEDKSTVKKVLHIEISKEDVAKELDAAYNELKKTATIKGFRKGKIPRNILESRFSKDIHADLVPRLIQNSYSEAP